MISDLLFALRVFVYAILIALFMQVQIGDLTLEDRTQIWLAESSTAQWVRRVTTELGSKIGSGVKSVSEKVEEKFSHRNEGNKKVTEPEIRKRVKKVIQREPSQASLNSTEEAEDLESIDWE